MRDHRSQPQIESARQRLAAPEVPGRVRRLGFSGSSDSGELTEWEIDAVLRLQLDFDNLDEIEPGLEGELLRGAFRVGFRDRKSREEMASSAEPAWREIVHGHHLQRASWRAGAWFYDEIFPDHVVKGARVEVYGYRACVQRLSLGLPNGEVASRIATDDRYALVRFEIRASNPMLFAMDPVETEWVPFSELLLIDQAAVPRVDEGCRYCGADPSSIRETNADVSVDDPWGRLTLCGCCGTPWLGRH